MKKVFTIVGAIIIASFTLTSCGGNSSEGSKATETKDPSATEQSSTSEQSATSGESESTESKSDCDQFIKDYEDFVNNYIVVIKKMKANPSDMSVMTEYSEMASKATSMQDEAQNCTDVKYAAKLSELSTKMLNAAADL